MNAPLTERLEEWLADVDGCNMSPVVERAFSLLREAKAALEELAAKQRIDEEQCDEMTAVAAEMTSRERGWMLRAKTAEAREAALTEALERIVDCRGTTYWEAWVRRIARDALAGTKGGAE